MKDLKTLKDFKEYGTVTGMNEDFMKMSLTEVYNNGCNYGFEVAKERLRAAAIDWYKELERGNGFFTTSVPDEWKWKQEGKMEFIKHFFKLTEEELA